MGPRTLLYGDKNYEIRLSGVSLVDVGAARISTVGEVYNLVKLEDFPGNYSAVTAGVTIRLQSSATGMRFNLFVEGLNIKLDGK